MTITDPITRVTIGTEFRCVVQDSNPLWRVSRKARHGVWDAVCINEPVTIDGKEYDSDHAGETRRFTAEQIVAALRWHEMWVSHKQSHDDYFATLTPGDVIHYHHSGGAFVRCEVVDVDGINKCKPIALVGKWSTMDLPRRSADGKIRYSSGGRFLGIGEDPRSGAPKDFEPWQPSDTCVYENPGYRGRERDGDPRTMEPIDLTVPEADVETRENERINRLRNDVTALLQDHTKGTDRERLETVARLIGEQL